jgi:2-keto-4-pentenoate hydratase/2-oxohepta-3-ene-1,7-dioic acid hydratase in catechol pathway
LQFVRFKNKEDLVSYGIYEKGKISELEGSIFEEFSKTGKIYDVNDVKLLAPCEPGKIFGVGLNFPDHIEELGYETPAKPANFLKPNSSIANQGEDIIIPKVAEQVDYEGELAIVIKDKIKDVTPEEAKKHILGVTPVNDLTERVLSFTPSLVTYCKAFDTFNPFGPIIDTDIDPDDTTIRTYLNGEKVQEGHTRDMVFKPSEIVSFLSNGVTFYPGDVILTGTPAGVKPIKEGDVVEVEIEGIEIKLRNGVINQK